MRWRTVPTRTGWSLFALIFLGMGLVVTGIFMESDAWTRYLGNHPECVHHGTCAGPMSPLETAELVAGFYLGILSAAFVFVTLAVLAWATWKGKVSRPAS